MLKKRGKAGNILTENVIFIILNLVFVSIIILFIFLRMNDSAILEEVYAKQIALMADSAKPRMIFSLNMEEGIEKAKNELGENNLNDIVKINGNLVTVSLRKGKSYSYSFFNNVHVIPNLNKEKDGFYFTVEENER